MLAMSCIISTTWQSSQYKLRLILFISVDILCDGLMLRFRQLVNETFQLLKRNAILYKEDILESVLIKWTHAIMIIIYVITVRVHFGLCSWNTSTKKFKSLTALEFNINVFIMIFYSPLMTGVNTAIPSKIGLLTVLSRMRPPMLGGTETQCTKVSKEITCTQSNPML